MLKNQASSRKGMFKNKCTTFFSNTVYSGFIKSCATKASVFIQMQYNIKVLKEQVVNNSKAKLHTTFFVGSFLAASANCATW